MLVFVLEEIRIQLTQQCAVTEIDELWIILNTINKSFCIVNNI